MTSSSPGPLNIGNIVSAAFTLYRSHFKTYLGISARAYLWILVPIYGWAKYAMLAGVISRMTYQEIINEPETFSNARNVVKPQLWAFLLAGLEISVRVFLIYIGFAIVFGILVGVITILAVGLGAAGGASMGPVAAILGVLAVILGIIASVAFIAGLTWFASRWSIAEVAISVERLSAGASVARSWELTAQAAFRVQIIMFVAALLTLPLLGVLSYVPSFMAAFAQPGSPMEVGATIASWIGSFAAGIVTMPFWQTLKGLIYYDLRSRKEGVDLKLRPRSV